ncbi:hypothetical protein LCX93_04885 [Sulfurimonas sp. SWIR-19]|uniref:Cas10/Cmr2 second palm domain-containing protein n=1 Tax=Sulfurimonas sp. SWIR-19 TaxID=2878390 RepID=UPI001CF247DA|nr:type III-B CRISPR-associated protein Cas10/Cmr2 [Sulfurimonas sp. SWIR-19]UCN01253.1 hypothetical protein LCX93_04885 [Sulfurimonas sp. SWIR-19]
MKYIALTIGPIYKTLQNAKNPKSLFASSYIFSYIMKEIIKEFRTREFVVPYIKDVSVFEENEIGVFHDRFIFEAKEGDFALLEATVEAVIQKVAQQLGLDYIAVKEYLQIHSLEKELTDEQNPILELMPYLDTQELFYQVTQSDQFVEKIHREKGGKDNFLTEGKNIVDDIKKLCYNKYYCIVHADGDKMGKAIAKKQNIASVSKALLAYCKEAHKEIKAYGGQTIFAGGDDLLFIAPVIRGGKSVFDLCDTISKDFQSKIKGATLSFGITVNYVKFPLYEALSNSRSMLFDKAKNAEKNNIAFMVTKHSGQSFEAIVHKNDPFYPEFLNFVTISLEKEGAFLHSIHHKIQTYQTVIEQIKNDEMKLQNFFDNYFNETLHNDFQPFFKQLVKFLSLAEIPTVYATLRLAKFLKGDK